jgi:hypothetical protein
MPLVLFDNFKGMAPRVDPHVLPEGFGQTAENVKLNRGILQSWNGLSNFLTTTTGINTIKKYKVGTQVNWLTWSAEVEAVINIFPGDTKQHVVWTDPADGIPKISRNDKLVFTGQYVKDTTDYFRLGVPAPTAAPGVTIAADAPDATRPVKYAYAWAHRGRIGGLSSTITVNVTQKQTAVLTDLDTTPNIAGSAWPNSPIEKFRKFIFRVDDTVVPTLYTLVGKVDNDTTTWMDNNKFYPRTIKSTDFHAAALPAPAAGASGYATDGQILDKNDRTYGYAFAYTDPADGKRKITPLSTTATITGQKDGAYVQLYNMAASSGLSGVTRIRKVIFRKDGVMTAFRYVASLPEGQTEFWDTLTRVQLQKKYSFWVAGAGSAPTAPTLAARNQFERELTRNSFYYVYTWVTNWGEESAPSPVSALVEPFPSDQVTITLPTSAPSSYPNVAFKRLYRTDSTGSFRVLFDSDVPLATASVIDDVAEIDLGDAIITTDWAPPPGSVSAPLKGLCALPNGVLCAGWGNQIGFSEPGYPYSWPVANQFTLDYAFVGAAVSANGVVVCTEGTPYLCQGTDPASMAPVRIELQQSCIAKGTIVDMGDFVIYASPDGLVAVSGFDAQLITEDLLTRDQWRAYAYDASGTTVSTLKATFYERKYLLTYNTGSVSGTLLFDPSERSLVHFPLLAPTAWFNDLTTDTLYAQDGTSIKVWDGSTPLTYTWKSGRKLVDRAVNFAYARVDAAAYPVTFKLYGDGVLKHTQVVASNRAFALPSGYRAFAIEVELSGTNDIRHVAMATDIRELM